MTKSAAILELILADPQLRDLAVNGIDNQIADLLNAPTVSVTRRIPMSKAIRWSVSGPNLKLRHAAAQADTAVAALAQGYLDLLASPITEIEVDAEFQMMLQVLTQQGVLTAAEVTALLARGAELVGRAEAHPVIGSPVHVNDVSEALAVYRLDGRVGGPLATESQP